MPQHADAIAARPREPKEMIGEGTFGKVYLVRSSSGEQVVLKESEAIGLSTVEKEAMLNEALILKRLQHPAIIAYRRAYIRGDVFCIEMEWATGGDLRSFIKTRRHEKRWLTETTIARHLWQLTSALAYCHKQNLLHRDLKTANIFLDALDHIKVRISAARSTSQLRRTSPARVTSQLGDFGISKILSSTQARPSSFISPPPKPLTTRAPRLQAKAMTQCGTPLYMCPEMCEGLPYTSAADVWALGCVLFEMMSLSAPWVEQMRKAGGAGGGWTGLMHRIATETLDVEALRGRYSDGICTVLSALLTKDPMRRPALRHVLTWPLAHSSS